jgi:hypothetical protein
VTGRAAAPQEIGRLPGQAIGRTLTTHRWPSVAETVNHVVAVGVLNPQHVRPAQAVSARTASSAT